MEAISENLDSTATADLSGRKFAAVECPGVIIFVPGSVVLPITWLFHFLNIHALPQDGSTIVQTLLNAVGISFLNDGLIKFEKMPFVILRPIVVKNAALADFAMLL